MLWCSSDAISGDYSTGYCALILTMLIVSVRLIFDIILNVNNRYSIEVFLKVGSTRVITLLIPLFLPLSYLTDVALGSDICTNRRIYIVSTLFKSEVEMILHQFERIST